MTRTIDCQKRFFFRVVCLWHSKMVVVKRGQNIERKRWNIVVIIIIAIIIAAHPASHAIIRLFGPFPLFAPVPIPRRILTYLWTIQWISLFPHSVFIANGRLRWKWMNYVLMCVMLIECENITEESLHSIRLFRRKIDPFRRYSTGAIRCHS